MNTAIDTLLIDPDLEARLRFKQASQLINVKVSVSTTTTLYEAIQRLDSLRSCDIVYISSRFDSEVLSGFVTSAKRTKQGKNVAFMMMVPAPECEMSYLARFALAGADGFLLEPYSASGLEGTIRTGLIAKHKRRISGNRIAVELLVKSLLDGLRDYRKKLKAGQLARSVRANLEKTFLVARNLEPAALDEYYKLLMERLIVDSKPVVGKGLVYSKGGTSLPRKVVRRSL